MSIFIDKHHIISVSLVALMGLMNPSFAIAAEVTHGEYVFLLLRCLPHGWWQCYELNFLSGWFILFFICLV
ncbi:MAG: hypothetical protein P8O84_03785, partial [Synechococcus sp. cluster3_bin.96]|nr:hypothetical protein [Synechococcus sp. cluster3_bin.96]